jgi:hypothetical protein
LPEIELNYHHPVPAEQLNQLTVNVNVTGTMSAEDQKWAAAGKLL